MSSYLEKKEPFLVRLVDCISDEMPYQFDRNFWVKEGNKYLCLQTFENKYGQRVCKLDGINMRYKMDLEGFIEDYGAIQGMLKYLYESEIVPNKEKGGFPAELFKHSKQMIDFKGELIPILAPVVEVLLMKDNYFPKDTPIEQIAEFNNLLLN